MYTNLDSDGFPATPINPRELLYFRSWQGPGLAKIFYYAGLIFLVLTNILHMIFVGVTWGVGGFFMAFFGGILTIAIGFIVIRILAELFLAILVIRQNTANGVPSSNSSGNGDGYSFSNQKSPFDKGNSFSGSVPAPDSSYQQV